MKRILLILLVGMIYFSNTSAQELPSNITNSEIQLQESGSEEVISGILMNTIYAEIFIVGAVYLFFRLQKQRNFRTVSL